MELPEELPRRYKMHVFACNYQRPPMHPKGSCGENGALPLLAQLKKTIEATGFNAEIGFTETGCMDACAAWPLMVIYPEGVWYSPQSPKDIEKIVETHLIGQKLVEERVVALR